MVIIISTVTDVHVPFVTKHLKGDFIQVDAGSVLDGKELSFKVQNGELTVSYEGKPVIDVTGIWLRRPGFITEQLKKVVQPGYIDYSRSALLNLADQFYSLFPDAVWVSDHFAIQKAENKVYQLVTAQKLGFNVPESIFTSSKQEARVFVKQHGEVIVKTLSNEWPDAENGKQKVFYAKKIKHSDDIDYEGLHIAPVIFQQLIEPQFEFRVTVVGDKVFAVKVEAAATTDRPGVRDWRFGQLEGESGVSFTAYDLDADSATKCVELVKHLGLQYGAIDLIQAAGGRIWFLEINPNGQWAFVQQRTGLPVGEAIAALLERREV